MTFKELHNLALRDYYPALLLERIVPRRIRSKVTTLAWSLVVLMFIAVIGFGSAAAAGVSSIAFLSRYVYGIFFFVLALWMIVVALQTFYNSFYFKDIPDREEDLPSVSFDLARVLYRTATDDIVVGFLLTHEGGILMLRAGMSLQDVEEFKARRAHPLSADAFAIEAKGMITLTDYLLALAGSDQEFSSFLFSGGLQKKELEAVSIWVGEREIADKRRIRWWSRDKLGRIPGLGKNWAYGNIYYLEEYCHDLPYVAPEYEVHSIYGTKELEELEAILVKTKGANVFLIGDDKEEQINVLARLNRLIDDGRALPELEHLRIVFFDNELFTSTMHTKAEFETKLLQLMHEAQYAGNIILVFADFASLMTSAQALGSDVVALLDQYFTAANLHLIGLIDTGNFHAHVEPNVALKQRFETILMEPIDENNTVKILENEIVEIEAGTGVFFTYPALVEIAEGAVRYFPEAMMPNKAIDLANEIAPKIMERGKQVVRKEDVFDLITTKTGIPVGEVGAGERDKLLGLEQILKQRIIGQDEAVAAVASAVRRARSGINNPNRPLASFLFLGPTGVGKTETTKALAEIFFGAEAKIERLDMSEYNAPDAVSKLIGSFDSGRQGVLTTMLREHPYGVLLLDEFEKTTSEVMNLFLQILDEGMFSDMSGKKINARNLLIIATSNAGADIIWEGLKVGDDFSQAKDFIIDAIIKAGTFKPELINRFDGVIVFHPLGKRELEKVAALQLEKLKARLAERGINLVINDDLISYVVGHGLDPKFGARPMNRAIQDKVEQVIAEKMIRGSLKKGQEIRLSSQELIS